MRVEAAVIRAHGAPLVVAELELDEPGPGEILVRLIATGVAACDVTAAGGSALPLPFVPGCEGAGIVERVGDGVISPVAGQAVVVAPRRGREQALGIAAGLAARFSNDDGPVYGGFGGQSSFATHMLCAAELAVPVADAAPLELIAGLGREVALGAGLVLQALANTAATTVVVTGADAVGLGACMVAAAVGCERIILADPRAARRELALTVGATIAVPADEGLAAVVRSLDAEGAGFAFETSGAPLALRCCADSLAPGGRCLEADDTARADLDFAAVLPRLAAMVETGTLPLEKLVAFFPFEQVNEALAALENGAVAKPVLRFPLGPFGQLDRALQVGAAVDVPEPAPDPAEAPAREEPPVTA